MMPRPVISGDTRKLRFIYMLMTGFDIHNLRRCGQDKTLPNAMFKKLQKEIFGKISAHFLNVAKSSSTDRILFTMARFEIWIYSSRKRRMRNSDAAQWDGNDFLMRPQGHLKKSPPFLFPIIQSNTNLMHPPYLRLEYEVSAEARAHTYVHMC